MLMDRAFEADSSWVYGLDRLIGATQNGLILLLQVGASAHTQQQVRQLSSSRLNYILI